MNCFRFLTRWGLGLVLALGANAAVAQSAPVKAWSFDQVSPAIYRLDTPITQHFDLEGITMPPEESDVIKTVAVQIQASTSAFIESYLCINTEEHCLPIKGGRIYTQAFAGYPANANYMVVHRVRGWSGTVPPVFIKTQLNVWW